MTSGFLLLVAVVALVLFVILEGRRQAKIYGRPSGRPNLLGVGMLEIQRHLQADRKTETLMEQQKEETTEVESDPSGAPPPDVTGQR